MSPARRILIPVARSFHTVSAMKARRVTTSHDEPLCIFNACSLNNDVCTNKTTSETILRPRGEQKADGAQRTRLVLHSDLTQWMIDSEGGCFLCLYSAFHAEASRKKLHQWTCATAQIRSKTCFKLWLPLTLAYLYPASGCPRLFLSASYSPSAYISPS